MDNNWNERLVGKLQTLNTTKDSIEAVSHWCTFYRNKAKVIVETWCRQFENADEARKISLLYLAHDILLRSKNLKDCDGFVEDFWRVLPKYLEDIYQNGPQFGKEVASKLVDLWEKQEVFKPGPHNLRAHFLGESRPSSLADGFCSMLPKKRKLEATLQAGATAGNILEAYQAAAEDYIDEATIWKAYEISSKRVKEIENEVHNCSLTGSVDITAQSRELYNELIHEETVLLECTNKMESNEKTMATLISKLKEAIKQEEHKLDTIRDQVKGFKDLTEIALRIRRNLPIDITKMAAKGSKSHVSRP